MGHHQPRRRLRSIVRAGQRIIAPDGRLWVRAAPVACLRTIFRRGYTCAIDAWLGTDVYLNLNHLGNVLEATLRIAAGSWQAESAVHTMAKSPVWKSKCLFRFGPLVMKP